MKAVILCGGKGLRMRGAAGFTCKPLVEVGGMPVLWHVMKIYKEYGINEFILCLGHGGDQIKEYFLNLDWKSSDFHMHGDGGIHFFNPPEKWDIVFADTGLKTMTGGRIKGIQKYIEEEEFMLTYGDGVADIPLDQLLKHHRDKGKIATVTAVKNRSQYGIIEVKNGLAESFKEKPMLDGWINAGFYVFKRKIFDYLSHDSCVLEEGPLKALVRENQLAVYRHEGFWQAVDTAKDVELINKLWASRRRPWVRW